jgi:ammonia channel protein AmtB
MAPVDDRELDLVHRRQGARRLCSAVAGLVAITASGYVTVSASILIGRRASVLSSR